MVLHGGVRSGVRVVLHVRVAKSARDARSVRDVMTATTIGVDKWAL